jgi:hypothetical protein
MKTYLGIVALSASLALAPALAHPADVEVGVGVEGAEPDALYDQAPADPPLAAADQAVYPAEPVDAPAEPAAPAAQGQWVRTSQYGWVWMPYGNGYAYAPPDGGDPLMYVYYPSFGWTWVIAPWLWGWGPMPFFGVAGWWHFGWWGHGFGRWDGFRGDHAFFHGRGVWHDGRWSGLRGVSPMRPRGVVPPRGFAPSRGAGAPWRGRVSSGSGFSGARPSHSQMAWAGRPAMPRGGFASHGGFRAPAAQHFAGFGGGGHGGSHLSGGSHGGGSHVSGGHSGGFHFGRH